MTPIDKIIEYYSTEEISTAIEALKKKYRRETRCETPAGEYDRAGRWYPSEQEKQICCVGLSRPTRNWNLSLLKHCCTQRHVNWMLGADDSLVTSLNNLIKKNSVNVMLINTAEDLKLNMVINKLVA